ncbi:hypothetical protein CRH01_41170 [Chryseobacterium rhizosphaerae]|nr:hypothetical protein CRH01_41170 [Chryseobacterium rhizosphaerae]
MKKIMFFLSLLIILSCKSQNTKNMLPLIDNNFEKFDNIRYNELHQNKSSSVYEKLNDGTIIERIKIKSGSAYYESPPKSYFMIFKDFYPSDNIRKKGLKFNVWGGFQKGTWYEFDEKGNLIKEIDYDKPYQFTFEDILRFCEKEGIPVTKGPVLQSTGFHTIITRRMENEKPIWEIEWLKKPSLVENIILDGISGKEISRKESKFINN